MFTKKTLFILGAGASIPYGYPSGIQLVKDIINIIKNDNIYFPLRQNQSYGFDLKKFNENIASCPKISNIKDNVYINKRAINTTITKNTINPDNEFIFYEIKLNEIEDVLRLQHALEQFSPVSIDTFLRDNPTYADAGKIMIIYTLLKFESISELELFNAMEDHWYPYLLDDILSGCADSPENILNNNLAIITFNYDVSLDFFLLDKLSKTERLKDKYPNKEHLEQFKINHVYGSLYGEAEFQYGEFSPNDLLKNISLHNLKRFERSYSLKSNIRTMYEERKKTEANLKELLSTHDEIIFIGFGFDRSNLNELGFPDKLMGLENDCNSLLPGKTIKYLNYRGEMTGLDIEFKKIADECEGLGLGNMTRKVAVIKSHANKITNAYFRDFKQSLFSK